MAESERVPGKRRIHASLEKLSRCESEKGRICVSTDQSKNTGEYREKIESVRVSKNFPAITGKRSNLCENRQIEESGLVPGKDRIRASIEKIPAGTGKGSNLCEYRKMEESGRVLGKRRIHASIEEW